MRDEIMRLANSLSLAASAPDGPRRIEAIATELRALARTDHVEDKLGMVPIKPGNWPEDSSHENGNYECKCCHCGATFYGHKRRVTCKVCASPAPDHSAGVGGMVSAAKAVIQRWDSPLWREQTSTAALINDLREAVNALAQPVTAGADGGK